MTESVYLHLHICIWNETRQRLRFKMNIPYYSHVALATMKNISIVDQNQPPRPYEHNRPRAVRCAEGLTLNKQYYFHSNFDNAEKSHRIIITIIGIWRTMRISQRPRQGLNVAKWVNRTPKPLTPEYNEARAMRLNQESLWRHHLWKVDQKLVPSASPTSAAGVANPTPPAGTLPPSKSGVDPNQT